MNGIKLNRNKIYLIGIFIIAVFIAINRYNYISESKFAAGKVTSIRTWYAIRGGSYSAPIIRFTADNYIITFQGVTNVELAPGDIVKVIYKKGDETKAEVFSFTGFLLPTLLYSLIPFMLLTAAAYSFLDASDLIVISLKSIYKTTVNKETESGIIKELKGNQK